MLEPIEVFNLNQAWEVYVSLGFIIDIIEVDDRTKQFNKYS